MKIGIIGLGDMGKVFAKRWANAGYDVVGCDLPHNRIQLENELNPFGISVVDDGIAVSRASDFILYCVEAENIEKVVSQCGPSTKFGAIVGGQTSVKTPEIDAFQKYLPSDVFVVTSHALFGPNVNPETQTLAVININAPKHIYDAALTIYKAFGSIVVELETFEEHDKMMADVQAITHIGFESIGTACMHRKSYPWENPLHPNGLDNVKFLLTLRIYSYKPHVYEGLALKNPYAKKDVRKYAQMENELFGMMISSDKNKFRKKIFEARDEVFNEHSSELMLDDSIMSEYSLNPYKDHKPNSHLSLLSMVCTWQSLKINPYKNLVCQTPPFKLRVGMAEYLFLNSDLLEEAIEAAVFDNSIKKDDLAFHTAVHEWANIVEMGDTSSYRLHFNQTRNFLKDRLDEGREKSSLLISRIANK